MIRASRILALSLALAPAAARADSIRCDGGIVSVGDAKIDLLGKCGPPSLVEDRWRRKTAVERWTYNFGPDRFLQFVTLVDGKVALVERGGYGYPPERLAERQERGRPRCDGSGIHVGDSKLDLLAKCGEPAIQESRLERRGDAAGRGSFVRVDVWTYDFGPRSFVQFATLENGTVVRVEHGSYGYAR
jgi:hypothetical protein